MSATVLPAPLWRRLAASVYDGLLLLALWMVAALADAIVRPLLQLPPTNHPFQLLLFLIGLGFFGWFWTHGGQTLGMRAWRLQVRRDDGSALRWPIAALRYAAMLLSWAVALTPALMQLPYLSGLAYAQPAVIASLALTVAGLLGFRLDGRRRAFCDLVSGTETVLLPKSSGEPVSAAA